MISSIKHKQSISWTFFFLNDAMAFSAKEMPKNHTDKERFAAALSCIQTGILTLLFPLKRRRSSPSPFISHRVLEAVASWILKSLITEIFHEWVKFLKKTSLTNIPFPFPQHPRLVCFTHSCFPKPTDMDLGLGGGGRGNRKNKICLRCCNVQKSIAFHFLISLITHC